MVQAPPTSQDYEKHKASGQEPNGERRRGQLVRAAAHVIEYEGLDALRMPRVAELAGCARTLVYRYFPTRDDLLMAVASEYYAALENAVDRRSVHRTALPLPGNSGPFELPLSTFDLAFDVVTELGLAGLLLRASSHLSEPMRDHIAKESARFSLRWIEPLRAAGLSDLHASLISHACVSVFVELVHRWQRAEITRDEAVSLCRTYCLALLHALLEPATK